MKQKPYFNGILIFSIFAILSYIIYFAAAYTTTNIKYGQIEGTSINLSEPIYLKGSWEIYDGELIKTKGSSSSPVYHTIPDYDDSIILNESAISYRMLIKNCPNKSFTVVINGIYEGYAIYLNNNLIKSSDTLIYNSEEIILPKSTSFYYNDQTDLEIVIEITSSNWGDNSILKSPILYTEKVFQEKSFIACMIKYSIIGALLFAAVYIFVLLGLKQKNNSSIIFATYCIVAALYSFTTKFEIMDSSYFIINVSNRTVLYSNRILLYINTLLLLFLSKSYNKSKYNTSALVYLFISIGTIVLTSIFLVNNKFFNFLYTDLINIILLIMNIIILNKENKNNQINKATITIPIFIVFGVFMDFLYSINFIFSLNPLLLIINLLIILIYCSINSFTYDRQVSKVEEIVELNKKIRNTEFTFLNSQIQSHFIYNTLNSIQSLCNTNPKKASELIEDFSMYLRTRLEFNKMPLLINIEDELNNIRTYLNIERARFGDRVKSKFELSVGEFQIPPLSVQPLVENSVKHGISMKKGGGTITVKTYEDDKFIYIVVSDDGVGFDPASLTEKQRVGTENIRDRLSLHIKAELTITSKIGVGTSSTIKIPKQK